MKKVIGNPIATPVPIPDYNQNNPKKADYIKNRPCYEIEDVLGSVDGINETQIPVPVSVGYELKVTFAVDSGLNFDARIKLQEGVTEYRCCVDCVKVVFSGMWLTVYNVSEEHDLSYTGTITVSQLTFKTLAEKYIPNTIARKDDFRIYIGEGEHSATVGTGHEALGVGSFAVGKDNKATKDYTVAEGRETQATGECAHAEGDTTIATHIAAHAEGTNTVASGFAAHAEGGYTKATNSYAHSEGSETEASGVCSHAEGYKTLATTNHAHAEGGETKATGVYAHAEGQGATSSGFAAHAEGGYTKATNSYAHSEGFDTEASGAYTHSEGRKTKSIGINSHAEGYGAIANGENAHAEGYYTIASGKNSHAQGKYNVEDTENKYVHIVGNGDSDTKRSNAYTLDWKGNAWFAGTIECTGIIMKSPNGTRFMLTVSDSGVLSASEEVTIF